MIGYCHHHVICPSVCNAVHCGSQSQCTGLKVVPAWVDMIMMMKMEIHQLFS